MGVERQREVKGCEEAEIISEGIDREKEVLRW